MNYYRILLLLLFSVCTYGQDLENAVEKHPVVTDYPILFVARKQYRPDHHNTATIFQTGEINHKSFVGGAALKTVDLKTGKVEALLETKTGMIRDPEVHFSGQKIIFSMRKDINTDYHIYEINKDGTGLKQLTSAEGVSDIDPLYLADDSIVFSSTREPKYCMCNRHIMANLFRMESDGANIHQIGKSTLFEGHGALMPDGRILYDRWEYVDRNFGDAQGLWTVNPDGTNHAVFWGNNINSPGGVIDARPVPDSRFVICTFGSCHDRPWGAIAMLDRRRGLDSKDAVIMTWPQSARDLFGKGNYDTYIQVKPKYEDPYPLTAELFLCSRQTGRGEQMGIYLLDMKGDEFLIHAEGEGCFDPMPLKEKKRPMIIPQRRKFDNSPGKFYITDVYQGTHMKGVRRGSAAYLRVVESPEKRFWVPSAQWGGQGQQNPAMGWHDFNNKRILGSVDVESDGSVYFEVPSGKYVYFQLLDEKGMMIQSMRSGTIVQPGETTGCVGCHEDRRSAPPAVKHKQPVAMTKKPQKLSGWFGRPGEFSYIHEVQPVFDKYCVRCHDFDKKAGHKLVLAGDRTNTFNVSYNELWRKKYISAIGAGPYDTQQAYSWGSGRSKIVLKILNHHNNIDMEREDFHRITAWIDINAPYYPTYASAYPHNLSGRSPLNNQQVDELGRLVNLNFYSLASFGRNKGPQVCFERPEMSPCLSVFEDKNSSQYARALEIINAGRLLLEKIPRADMENFVPWEVDRGRQQKYALRKEIEDKNNRAILNGHSVYDSN